jgi:hypothetical protein
LGRQVSGGDFPIPLHELVAPRATGSSLILVCDDKVQQCGARRSKLATSVLQALSEALAMSPFS